MAQEFSPIEIFKRATATTLRAIAENDEVNVTFGPDAGGARCGKAGQIAQPGAPRSAGRGGRATARRRGQSSALRVRLPQRFGAFEGRLPGGESPARAIFEVAGTGAGRGSRHAAHGRGRRGQPLGDARRAIPPPGLRTASPSAPEGTMAEAVRLLTREALTSEPPPPAARRVVDSVAALAAGQDRQGPRRAR